MSVSSCPSCREEISLPATASRSATVRCPMCQDEFEMSTVYDKLPPELIVVDDPDASQLVGATAGQASSEAGFSFGGDSPEPGGYELSSDSAAPAFQFNEGPAPSAEDGAPSPASTSRSAPRRQRKQKSPIWEIVKVAGGGVVGIVGALLIMWWGLKKDPLEFGPSVAKFAPWIVPEQFRGNTAAPIDDDNVNNTANQNSGGGNNTNLASNQGTDLGKPTFEANEKTDEEVFNPLNNNDTDNDDNSGNNSTDNDNGSNDNDNNNNTVDNPPVAPPESTTVEISFRNPPFKATSDLLNAADELKSAGATWWRATENKATHGKVFYQSLAAFGETYTHIEDTSDLEVQSKSDSVKALLVRLANEPVAFDFIANSAQLWMDNTSPENSGICLAGTVLDVQTHKNGFVTQFQLGTAEKTELKLLCLNKPPAGFEPGKKVIVMGVLVKDTAEELEGYAGNDSNLICCTMGIPLETPETAPMPEPETPKSPVTPPADLPTIPVPDIGLPTIPVPSIDPSGN